MHNQSTIYIFKNLTHIRNDCISIEYINWETLTKYFLHEHAVA